MRAANVAPVEQLLRLACQGTSKYFALVSSLAVCYSTEISRRTSEDSDPATYLEQMPLGYAQSKAVAERLVRHAVERSLDATIFRPALITGHSSGSCANRDFVSSMIEGCVRLGWAPDVDWNLDAVPVDFVAAAIAGNLNRQRGLRTIHIDHPEPRAWRDLVLFLNLYGYGIHLEPYDNWCERLARFGDKTLALRRFMDFFMDRPEAGGGQTIAQIYQAGGKPRISSARSSAHLYSQGLEYPKLDARFFDTYLTSLVRERLLVAPPRGLPVRGSAAPPDARMLGALRPTRDFTPADLAELRYARLDATGSITTEISAWRHSGPMGVYGIASHASGGDVADLVLKIKPTPAETTATASEVAGVCNPRLGSLFERFGSRADIGAALDAETAIYTGAIPGIAEHAPRCLASGTEPGSGRPMLLLERLADATLLNSVDSPELWTDGHIRVAIRDLARMHALHYGEDAPARLPMMHRLQPAEFLEAMDLWSGLCAHGKTLLADCGGNALASRVRELVFTAAQWAPEYDRHVPTLVHNDCNPRNMAFRVTDAGLSLCLYDWELATIAPPQRDLAELLCFTLATLESAAGAGHYVELHRQHLSRLSGAAIDVNSWNRGFRLALADLMVRRLSMYTMLHSCSRQSFLPRVLRTWQILDRVIP